MSARGGDPAVVLERRVAEALRRPAGSLAIAGPPGSAGSLELAVAPRRGDWAGEKGVIGQTRRPDVSAREPP